MHEIGVREVVQFLGLTFNWETLKMTWLAMAIVILIAVIATRRLSLEPKGAQLVIESIIEFLHEQIGNTMGKRGMFYAPLIVTLFLFILVSNLIGLIPTLASPTNDLNTTLGLALMVVIMVHFLGLYYKGSHYIAHFFQPFKVFFFINLVDEIAKPITLSFRLFGNILAGEILIIILLQLAKWWVIPSVAWLAFSIFVGVVQALIFTMLTMAYLGNSVKDEHES
ncbi:MAG: F0F1 ATP synthase subunit A [Selenomonadaceae bacterium]|nr:F0F1 ATP synthase subunit A [Selenomonadaceae bacterium]MBR3723558.1 F0F1 ATP synthase subunit A [Selenomonadaceae bacterium]